MQYIKIRFARFILFSVTLALFTPSLFAQTQLMVGTEAAIDCGRDFAWGCNFLGSPARTSTFNLPGTSGLAQLQSWTISPDPGIGLDGTYSYVFRLVLANVEEDGSLPKGSPAPCVTSIDVPFGSALAPYDNVYPAGFDAYMLANPYGGTIDLTGAELNDNVLRLTFPDVCAGDITKIFGVTSTCSGQLATADVTDVVGNVITVPARVPTGTSDGYLWPLSGCASPDDRDELNTSFGPRINNDRWDFHNGLDLPAAIGTPVHAAQDGEVIHAADGGNNGISSRHIVIREHGADPNDLVHLHLSAIDPAVVVGQNVFQGQRIGESGNDGVSAGNAHLHFEVRETPAQVDSTHPLAHLTYGKTTNFTVPVAGGFNRLDASMAARLLFEAPDKEEGDLLRVEVDLLDTWGLVEPTRVVDFNDNTTYNQANLDEYAYLGDIAVEGYQSSNMSGQGRVDAHYGVLVRNLPDAATDLQTRVIDVSGNVVQSAVLPVPNQTAFDESVDFESSIFPPTGWSLTTSGATALRTTAAAHAGTWGMLSTDTNTSASRDVAALEIDLPADRFEWVAEGCFNPPALGLSGSQNLLPIFFRQGSSFGVAARVRSVSGVMTAGIIAKSADGSFPFENGTGAAAVIQLNQWRHWRLHLARLATREATAVLYLDGVEVARQNWDSSAETPDNVRLGIGQTSQGATATLRTDDLLVTEHTPSTTSVCP